MLRVNAGETCAPYRITRKSSATSATSQRTNGRRRSGSTFPPPCPQRRRDPQQDEPVERDREDQERALERHVPGGRHAHHDERAVDRVQQERAERGAEDAAAATE